jgi:hypothetical protein
MFGLGVINGSDFASVKQAIMEAFCVRAKRFTIVRWIGVSGKVNLCSTHPVIVDKSKSHGVVLD